jgi:hypothetical protein
MKTSQPTIDDILHPFFDAKLAARLGITRQRIARVEQLLRECLESEGERVLIDRDRVVLATEREFASEGAFARTMHADDLVYVISIFLELPWLQSDPQLQRAQLAVAEWLTARLVNGRLMDHSDLACPLLDIRASIDRARRELDRERRERSRRR